MIFVFFFDKMLSLDIIIDIFKFIEFQNDFLKIFFISNEIQKYYSKNFNNIPELYDRFYHIRLFGKEKYFINFSEFTKIKFRKINAFTSFNISPRSFKYFSNAYVLDIDFTTTFNNFKKNKNYSYLKNIKHIILNNKYEHLDYKIYFKSLNNLKIFTKINNKYKYITHWNEYNFSINLFIDNQ